ncbi:MAG: ATP-binding protein [Chloroflexota bacterium]|nr:ATP-binding protein [Chloroflexota bacterium]
MAANSLASEDVRYRALLAAIRTPILSTSLDGRINGFNSAAVALFGSPARLYGRRIREVLPFVHDPLAAGSADTQGCVADATGRTVDLEVSRTLLDEDHQRGSAVYVVHDISRHAELNRLREQLLYSVAHELRGPVMILDHVLDMLAQEYDVLTTREFAGLLGKARRTARHIGALMQDLLSAGTIQSGRFVVAPRPTELSTIVRDAVETVKPLIDSRRQALHLELADGPLVLADMRYAPQVVCNLLTNASKYGPAESVIRVVAGVAGNMVQIAVEDQGAGIPPEQQAGLFERFYRVRAATDPPGVGLGLAIAKGIVEAHRGTIGIDTEPGSGTRVWFTLPLAGRCDAHPAGRR